MNKDAEWKIYYEDGRAYRKTARGALRRPQIFTPEIMLNLIGMAIEKYLMAVFIQRGTLPFNHTMCDLADGLDELDAATRQAMFDMDELQQMCSVEDIRIRRPKPEDIHRFLLALEQIAAFAEGTLKPCAT